MSVDFRLKRIVLDEPTSSFLQSLGDIRREAGMSRKALARTLNISPANITDYESGKRTPSVEMLIRLTELFGYDLSESLNYQLYHGQVNLVRLRRQLKRYGFSYMELARLTGYSHKSVRNCFHFTSQVTPQCLHAVLEVLEHERQSYNFSVALIRKGMKYGSEDEAEGLQPSISSQ